MEKQREICKGEIYWSNQPYCKGHLQKGNRPYLVISSRNNKSYATVLPISSKIKPINNRCNIRVRGQINQVICDQPQTITISTLGRYVDRVSEIEVENCLETMLKFL